MVYKKNEAQIKFETTTWLPSSSANVSLGNTFYTELHEYKLWPLIAGNVLLDFYQTLSRNHYIKDLQFCK